VTADPTSPHKIRPPSRFLIRWHRRIGLTAAIFVIILSVTGLLLTFASGLGLKDQSVSGPLISAAYNMAPSSDPLGVSLAGQTYSWVDGTLYPPNAPAVPINTPQRAFIDDAMVHIIGAEAILILTEDGQLIERMTRGEVSMPGNAVAFSPLSGAKKADALSRFRGAGQPLERLILDIHTGRFFGPIGPWVMAISSVLLITLSISGLIMWTGVGRRRRFRQSRRRRSGD